MLGDLNGFTAILRSDPLSRLAALLLPSDALAMLPIVQDLTETEMAEAGYARLVCNRLCECSCPCPSLKICSHRDVPYTPSFVLPLSDLYTNIRNVRDFTFLSGFNNPTICLLFCPTPTYVGRYSTVKDTFQLEIRTLDITSKTYASLVRITGLPSDCLYIVPCPSKIGGVLVICETSIIHIDQSGNTVLASVNGWFSVVSGRTATDRSHEHFAFELDDSRVAWLGGEDAAMIVLNDGSSHLLTLKMEGRAVSKIDIGERLKGRLAIPSTLLDIAGKGFFVGCAVGDSQLARVELKEFAVQNRETVEAEPMSEAQKDAMDEDLEGEWVGGALLSQTR